MAEAGKSMSNSLITIRTSHRPSGLPTASSTPMWTRYLGQFVWTSLTKRGRRCTVSSLCHPFVSYVLCSRRFVVSSCLGNASRNTIPNRFAQCFRSISTTIDVLPQSDRPDERRGGSTDDQGSTPLRGKVQRYVGAALPFLSHLTNLKDRSFPWFFFLRPLLSLPSMNNDESISLRPSAPNTLTSEVNISVPLGTAPHQCPTHTW